MKQAIIVGGGGLGSEILGWLEDLRSAVGGFEIRGFLDNSGTSHVLGLPVLADPMEFEPGPEHLLVCAIGDPRGKLGVTSHLSGRGGRWLTLVHPSARVGIGSYVAEGSVLCPGAVVTVRATLGKFVLMNINATVGHDAMVGDCATLSAHADVTGRVVIEEGALLGSHAVVIPDVRIGKFATVGAGSVATRNVSDGWTVFGVPARRVWDGSGPRE
jgi:sugar O-acyltransferase (sialic acid O-acetyltransferase NeuD family)